MDLPLDKFELREARLRAQIARRDGERGGHPQRLLSLEIIDLRAKVGALAADGDGLVGGIGEHENTWLMAYVRGPEATPSR